MRSGTRLNPRASRSVHFPHDGVHGLDVSFSPMIPRRAPFALLHLLRAAPLALATCAACIVVHDDTRPSSPIDTRLSPPSTPSIDLLYDLVFSGISCTPSGAGGIAGWRGVLNGEPVKDSGVVSCWDAGHSMPFGLRFEQLQGGATYTLDVYGYPWDSQSGAPSAAACFTAHCTADTTTGPYAVLPSCTLTRTC
jgi:hypothetical protein